MHTFLSLRYTGVCTGSKTCGQSQKIQRTLQISPDCEKSLRLLPSHLPAEFIQRLDVPEAFAGDGAEDYQTVYFAVYRCLRHKAQDHHPLEPEENRHSGWRSGSGAGPMENGRTKKINRLSPCRHHKRETATKGSLPWYFDLFPFSPRTAAWRGNGLPYPAAEPQWSCPCSPAAWPAGWRPTRRPRRKCPPARPPSCR